MIETGEATLVSEAAPSSNTEEMKRGLLDPRAVSKNIDPTGRSRTASDISEARAALQATKQNIDQESTKAADLNSQIELSLQQEAQLQEELALRSNKLLVKLKGLIGIKDQQVSTVEHSLNDITEERQDLTTQLELSKSEIERLQALQAEIPTANQLLDAYYEKVLHQPLSNEQKRELLKPEVVASLSTEEYIALWRRLNPYFLSHVTRQGFRDHNAIVYHSGGIKEFHNGFTSVIADGRMLRPPIAVEGLRSRDETSVKKYLESWVLQAENVEDAKKRLFDQFNASFASAPAYPDMTAIHFANQIVADSYYGGERENEVFYVFPTDVIASQYDFAFNGDKKDFTKPQNETKWNDIFVWPASLENPGILLDAGIVFLPESAAVDPLTGSKYASEVEIIDGVEKRVMIEDVDLVQKFFTYIKGIDTNSAIYKIMASYHEEIWGKESIKNLFIDVCSKELVEQGFVPEAASALAQKLFGELSLQYAYRKLNKDELGNSKIEIDETSISKVINESGAQYKRATETVSSKQYWQDYFSQYPHLQPKHVVYYQGSPTTAVFEFQQAHGIGQADTSKSDGKLLGFDDKHIFLKEGSLYMKSDQDPRAMKGYDELMALGNKIVEEHYATQTATAESHA